MDEGFTVPIICRSVRAFNDGTEEMRAEELAPASPRFSPHIHVTKRVKLQPYTQTWVEVSTKRQVLILVEMLERLYNDNTSFTVACFADVCPEGPLKLLVENFGPKIVKLKSKQVLAMMETHPENLFESHISHP